MRDWKLFTYAITHDTGYAPNPFHGICTLNTCKPQIRREADIGDWIVGLKKDRVIYIMKVTKIMCMSAYWEFCQSHYPEKIPQQNGGSEYSISQCGDCQYYDFSFSGTEAKILPGFHDLSNMKTDLSGKKTLLSEHFVYFGSMKKRLPSDLLPIAKYSNGNWIGQARKSIANAPYREKFLGWVKTLPYSEKAVLAEPADNPCKDNLQCSFQTQKTSVYTGRCKRHQ